MVLGVQAVATIPEAAPWLCRAPFGDKFCKLITHEDWLGRLRLLQQLTSSSGRGWFRGWFGIRKRHIRQNIKVTIPDGTEIEIVLIVIKAYNKQHDCGNSNQMCYHASVSIKMVVAVEVDVIAIGEI